MDTGLQTDGRFMATSPGALLAPFGSQQGLVLAGSTGHTLVCFDSAKDVPMYLGLEYSNVFRQKVGRNPSIQMHPNARSSLYLFVKSEELDSIHLGDHMRDQLE